MLAYLVRVPEPARCPLRGERAAFSATCEGPRRCTVISSSHIQHHPGPACETCIPAPVVLGPLPGLLELAVRSIVVPPATKAMKARAQNGSLCTSILGCLATGADRLPAPPPPSWVQTNHGKVSVRPSAMV